MKGFYVPDSMSSSYVANKRNETGGLLYESAANDLGIAKQQAVQTLEQNYAQTIDNAYSAYLAANKNVLGSQMGQGYKEAYLENQRQQLQRNIAETNLSAAQARQELGTQEAQAQQQITQAFQSEVSNFDRAAQSMSDYLAYVKSLTSQDGTSSYLSDEYKDLGVDELYHVLFEAQPQGFIDVEGNAGMNFLDWTRSKLGTSSADDAYRQWLYGQGGYQELRTQLSAKSQKAEQDRALKKAQEQQKAEIAKSENHILTNEEGTYNKGKHGGSGDINWGKGATASTVTIEGKEYRLGKYLKNFDDTKALNDELTQFFKDNGGVDNRNLSNNPVIIRYNGEYYVSHKASYFSEVEWRKLDKK